MNIVLYYTNKNVYCFYVCQRPGGGPAATHSSAETVPINRGGGVLNRGGRVSGIGGGASCHGGGSSSQGRGAFGRGDSDGGSQRQAQRGSIETSLGNKLNERKSSGGHVAAVLRGSRANVCVVPDVDAEVTHSEGIYFIAQEKTTNCFDPLTCTCNFNSKYVYIIDEIIVQIPRFFFLQYEN